MTIPERGTRSLPERPDLRHLKDQAKDLQRSGGAATLAEAQFKLAREYGFAGWPKLKAHVELLANTGQLSRRSMQKSCRVIELVTRNPALHRAPLGYGKNGPLTWVAECRTVVGPPSRARLQIAEWMIDHGRDVHQGRRRSADAHGANPRVVSLKYGRRLALGLGTYEKPSAKATAALWSGSTSETSRRSATRGDSRSNSGSASPRSSRCALPAGPNNSGGQRFGNGTRAGAASDAGLPALAGAPSASTK